MVAKGTRVLVTGACGSIGSSIVEELLFLGCEVCAFDQNEDGLFHLDQKYKDNYRESLKLFVGSVRDENRLDKALEGVEIVFHCAALKHVYLSEYNPFEVMQTNIHGVNNIINSSLRANVSQVIFTSSDKAVNPSSTMGATKLLGERLITAANHHSGSHSTRFSSVRFGNVLNTNGSVLHIFRKQIEEKKPLTIKSKNATYNTSNFNSRFKNNVKITYLNHLIEAENVYIDFKNNFILIKDNVVYDGPLASIASDGIKIDLVTKNISIFMDKKLDDINLKSKK